VGFFIMGYQQQNKHQQQLLPFAVVAFMPTHKTPEKASYCCQSSSPSSIE